MKEYIEREAALAIAAEWCADDDGSVGKIGDLREMLDEIEAIPAADVVPWEWLERYAQGMRMNYASEWVMEAKKRYEEGIH